MAEAILIGGGGSGADLDVVTAAAGDVAKGKVFVNNDWDPVTGTLELTGTANNTDVLANKTYYNTDLKTKRTGNIPVKTSSNSSLNCGQSRTVEYGYYGSAFTVTANSLASQTSGTATAAQIKSGQTAWVNGVKITGSMAVQTILSFDVAPSGYGKLKCTWTNPSKGPFAGVIITCNDTEVYRGYGSNSSAGGTSTVVLDLSKYAGGLVDIEARSYIIAGGELMVSRQVFGADDIQIAKEQYTFTQSGTFYVPIGCYSIDVFAVGGGGGGGGARTYPGEFSAGGGGGGGEVVWLKKYAVTPGDRYAIVIGAGGTAGPVRTKYDTGDGRWPDGDGDGGKGSSTSMRLVGSSHNMIEARGGWFGGAGWTYSNWNANTRARGGDGGSPMDYYRRQSGTEDMDIKVDYYAGSGGGGGSVWSRPSSDTLTGNVAGAKGGSDGDYGNEGSRVAAGIEPGSGGLGQGYTMDNFGSLHYTPNTCRLFGDSSKELYSGGGGGGCCGLSCYDGKLNYIGYGGEGGGGNSPVYGNGGAGTAGTGGGGAGGPHPEGSRKYSGGAGGSGVLIIVPHLS